MDILEDHPYPSLDRLELLQPGPQILLGNEITYTLKHDGTNCGVALIDGKIEIRSSNQPRAHPNMYESLKKTPEYDGIVDLLESAADWRSQYILYGELLQVGRSPTRIKTHTETRFVPFDLWSARQGGFVNYISLYQQCHHAHLPCVEVLGKCTATSLPSLYAFRDEMFDICRERNEEGVVGKVWADTPWSFAGMKKNIIYFKEKLDTPNFEQTPKMTETGRVILPQLSDSEVFGAVEKARTDLGDRAFRDPAQAMPKIVAYVREEGKKHHCSSPKNIQSYYLRRLQDISLGVA